MYLIGLWLFDVVFGFPFVSISSSDAVVEVLCLDIVVDALWARLPIGVAALLEMDVNAAQVIGVRANLILTHRLLAE